MQTENDKRYRKCICNLEICGKTVMKSPDLPALAEHLEWLSDNVYGSKTNALWALLRADLQVRRATGERKAA